MREVTIRVVRGSDLVALPAADLVALINDLLGHPVLVAGGELDVERTGHQLELKIATLERNAADLANPSVLVTTVQTEQLFTPYWREIVPSQVIIVSDYRVDPSLVQYPATGQPSGYAPFFDWLSDSLSNQVVRRLHVRSATTMTARARSISLRLVRTVRAASSPNQKRCL